MTTALDIMHPGAMCVGERESLTDAARIMREQDIGALPICGDDDVLVGILTDRDIVLKCVAEKRDPSEVTCGELAMGRPQIIEGDEQIERVLELMEEYRVRRLPVIDHPAHRLIGMITEADVARHLPQERVAEFVSAVCCD
ncbi:CBS domain-containing protein [Actinacidiphila glaucinigra]|uniref:CBS domain-containing protein n=1 Tax=Actinacidiphila glaucinigra TaxID=235986 RepID=A0A239MCK5_9ACTN|nr:CBS domain-containing protein [Actinacidiphila glaucinigra]WSD61228.1 CBS domain-containing protein [Actinacidiphila glaucinigra]SNT39549.1 CBS domain-containing protein [Actinacidiphila glaucinigra]